MLPLFLGAVITIIMEYTLSKKELYLLTNTHLFRDAEEYIQNKYIIFGYIYNYFYQ